MAINTAAQLAASSSAVYTTNGANAITAALVRPFNDNFISSSILVNQPLSQSFELTGSAVSKYVQITVASNTASIDCRAGNLCGVTLGSSATTFFNFTNILEGQSGNVVVSAASAASASFSTNVKQVSGSAYAASSGASQTDLLSFVTQGGNVYIVNSKRFV
jgi:NADPH-dependent curcumin reductase CurA